MWADVVGGNTRLINKVFGIGSQVNESANEVEYSRYKYTLLGLRPTHQHGLRYIQCTYIFIVQTTYLGDVSYLYTSYSEGVALQKTVTDATKSAEWVYLGSLIAKLRFELCAYLSCVKTANQDTVFRNESFEDIKTFNRVCIAKIEDRPTQLIHLKA